jgi:hypothetical protein
MKIMGIEFAGSSLYYVVIELQGDGSIAVMHKNKMKIGDTDHGNPSLLFKMLFQLYLTLRSLGLSALKQSQSLDK